MLAALSCKYIITNFTDINLINEKSFCRPFPYNYFSLYEYHGQLQ